MRKIHKTTAGSANKKVPVGTYTAEIVDVCDSPKHEPGEAFVIKYNLVDADGNIYSHSETFYYSNRNPRTCEFNKYLDRYDIGDYDELVGRKEHITIGRSETSWGALLPTIIERVFIDDEE